MTPGANQQFNLNMDTIARFAGFRPVEKFSEEVVCESCDCDGEHRCINCGDEIAEAGCRKREGMCVDCWNDFQWSLKN